MYGTPSSLTYLPDLEDIQDRPVSQLSSPRSLAKSQQNRPSKLCENHIFTSENVHPWKIFTPKKYSLLKNIHLWKIFIPEKFSSIKNIYSWKLFTPEKYSHPKNIHPQKIFTPKKYSFSLSLSWRQQSHCHDQMISFQEIWFVWSRISYRWRRWEGEGHCENEFRNVSDMKTVSDGHQYPVIRPHVHKKGLNQIKCTGFPMKDAFDTFRRQRRSYRGNYWKALKAPGL